MNEVIEVERKGVRDYMEELREVKEVVKNEIDEK